MATRKTSETKANAPASAQPQDHKMLPEQTPGWDLLIPFKQVTGANQLRLMGALKKLLPEGVEAGAEIEDMDFEELATFIEFVGEKFAKDPKEFDEWTMGKDGYNRALTLATAYGSALGE